MRRIIRMSMLSILVLAISTVARAQEITSYSEYKRAVKKAISCTEELAKLNESVRLLEKNLKKLRGAKAPDKESKKFCRNECATVIDHYNERVDSIYAKSVSELTPADKEIRDLCGAGKSCKILQPPVGQPEKDLDAKGGTCGIVYSKSVTKQGEVRRHYEQVLNAEEQAHVNACWWVQNQIEISETARQLKTGEENGKQTLVSERDAKDEECTALNEKFEDCDTCAIYAFRYAQERQIQETWKITDGTVKGQSPIDSQSKRADDPTATKIK